MKKLLVLLAGLAFAAGALAQEYPSRPIKLMHGFAPGGNADTSARILAAELSKSMNVPVVVEPKPGAGGNIGADAVAKSAPDGYTLLLVTGGHAVVGPLYNSLPFRPLEDFEWISLATTFPFAFVVRSGGKYQTLPELIAGAKAKPDSVTFGTPGIGATPHLVGEYFGSLVGAKFLHVPYKGDSAAITALLGGEIDFIITAPTAALPHIKAGKMKAVAVSGATRWKGLPDVPAAQESGAAGFDVKSWVALAAPAGTPRPVVMRLHAEMQKLLQVPDARGKLEGMGGEVQGSTPEEMRARVAEEMQRWARVIREANIPRQ
jgi:tripartite-type tricarboxylate transporter receptor subunit TctC